MACWRKSGFESTTSAYSRAHRLTEASASPSAAATPIRGSTSRASRAKPTNWSAARAFVGAR